MESAYGAAVPLRTHPDVANSSAKRAFDLAVASLMLVLLLPVFLMVAIALTVESRGAVLHTQERIGLDGRPFRIRKFRTMVRGAEALKVSLLERNEAPYPAFKIRKDPRVTRVGRFLRRSSLDELPQLWNVVFGEMSLVGPRPGLPEEVACYDESARVRLSARPGLTCTWQVAYRHKGTIEFADWVRLDREYIERWSFRQDILILLRTVKVVVALSGC